jgi:hypothetical protein
MKSFGLRQKRAATSPSAVTSKRARSRRGPGLYSQVIGGLAVLGALLVVTGAVGLVSNAQTATAFDDSVEEGAKPLIVVSEVSTDLALIRGKTLQTITAAPTEVRQLTTEIEELDARIDTLSAAFESSSDAEELPAWELSKQATASYRSVRDEVLGLVDRGLKGEARSLAAKEGAEAFEVALTRFGEVFDQVGVKVDADIAARPATSGPATWSP